MKKKLIAIITILVLAVMSCSLVACSKDKKKDDYGEEIVNGGFEQEVGALPGWTAEGNAFGKYGVVNTSQVNGVTVGKVGNNFFSGYDAGSVSFTGTLTSTPFKLAGTGKIGYRIGSGQDPEKCYIEIIDNSSGETLYKKGNEDFGIPYVTDQLIPNVADLSAHIGKTLVIKVTDNDKERDSYSYLNLDDFKVLATEDEVAALTAERTSILAEIGAPSFEEDQTETQIRNGSFEDGLTNWLVLSGDAFSKATISPSTKTFFGERVYNAVGDKFLDGYNVSEKNVGVIRSAKFTLSGDGFISLLIGGAKESKNYVAICDGESDEELFKITCDHFKDPEMSLNLMRKFIDASDYLGDVLYVKIVDGDNRASDYAAISVDDIRVSMTNAETKALVNETYIWAQGLEENAINAVIRNYYNTYDYPFQPEVLRLKTPVASKAMHVRGGVDLEAYLDEAEGSYGDVDSSQITISIDKVVSDKGEITSGFNSVDLTEAGLYTVHYSAHYETLSTPATFVIAVSEEDDVLNGGFETGNLAGWTVSDDKTGTPSMEEVFWDSDAGRFDQNGKTVHYTHKEGTYFYDSRIPDEAATVTLTSNAFTLGGDGIITFKLGAGKGSGCYVALCDSEGEELLKQVNTQFNDPLMALSMQRWFMDASAYIGEEVCIKIVDNETSGFAFIRVDSVKASLTYEQAKAILDADKEWASTYRQDVLDSDGATTTAKQIVQAQRNYYENLNVTDPRVINISKGISPQYSNVNEQVNFAPHKVSVKCTILGTETSNFTVSITGVKKNGVAVTPFDESAFTPTEEGTYVVTYEATDGTTSDSGEYKLFVRDYTRNIINGDFELGNLTGWTVVSGTAFADVNVFGATSYWGTRSYNQEGDYHLDGWQGAGENATGVLKSSTFTLGGTGKISFRLGGRNGDNAYISVKKADGTEVARFTNTKQRGPADESDPVEAAYMYVYVFDLTGVAQLGDELYIEITDNATEGWGLLFVDDIQTYHTQDSLAALGTEDTDWFAATNLMEQAN